jgi:hypothetical protein
VRKLRPAEPPAEPIDPAIERFVVALARYDAGRAIAQDVLRKETSPRVGEPADDRS